jgi:peroxiredoxin
VVNSVFTACLPAAFTPTCFFLVGGYRLGEFLCRKVQRRAESTQGITFLE